MAESVAGVHGAEAHLVAPPVEERRLGLDVGRLEVPEDFDAPLPDDLLGAFSR